MSIGAAKFITETYLNIHGKLFDGGTEKFVVLFVADVNHDEIFFRARDARVNHFRVEKFFFVRSCNGIVVADNQNIQKPNLAARLTP